MKMTTATHSGRTVTYNPDVGKFLDELNVSYSSVESTVRNHFPQPKTVVDFRHETRCRETAAAMIQGMPPPHEPETDAERETFKGIWTECKRMTEDCKVLTVEQLVLSERYHIAGIIDLTLRRPDGTTVLLTWQLDCNEDIDYTDTATDSTAALWPIANIPGNNTFRHAMELSMLAEILRVEEYLNVKAQIDLAMLLIHPTCVKWAMMPDMETETLRILLAKQTDVPF